MESRSEDKLQKPYQPRVAFEPVSCQLGGLRYAVKRWGAAAGRPVWLLHGWMDCAATFQFLVDALPADWLAEHSLFAPDWRGFGDSQWNAEGYYFPDYLADLELLLDHFSPAGPVALVGHSMGGMVAGLYAGIRPERVSRLVSLEGFGLPATQPEQAVERYGRWLTQRREALTTRPFASLDEVAERLRRNNSMLDQARALWLAPFLAAETEPGHWVYRADPKHRWVNPVLYRLEEAMACWRACRAATLWLAGDEAKLLSWLKLTPEQFAERQAAFSGLRYQVLPGCGHNLHHDNPAAVATALVEFWRETTAD
ncbi:alpha/beta fold hydrolase [Chitinimonas lacunae]|uniref:Alpha/beta fold hydrolase n=1 Tax=Chitinimonas lacunae TaxID=1963018 RepID=A0ABV8MIW3_9NEIS